MSTSVFLFVAFRLTILPNNLQKREYHLQAIGTPIKGSETEPATPEPPSKKRKRATESTTPARENGRASVGSSGKKTRPEREDEERPHASEEEDITTTTTNTPRRSTRAASRVQYAENEYANDELEGDEEALAEVAAEYDQTVVKDEVVEDGYVGLEVEGLESMPQDAEEEEEELDEKKDFKPVMKLSYTGEQNFLHHIKSALIIPSKQAFRSPLATSFSSSNHGHPSQRPTKHQYDHDPPSPAQCPAILELQHMIDQVPLPRQ